MLRGVERFKTIIKPRLPYPVLRLLSILLWLKRSGRRPTDWWIIWRSGTADQEGVRIFYGRDHIPRPSEPASGGIVKFQPLQDLFPNSPRRFNLLYMVSSALPADGSILLWLANRKKVRFVWNQNGVAYPGWHGPGWEQINRPMQKMLHAADYVFYQSRFCKLSADRFLGERSGPGEILYNVVDTSYFTPATSNPADRRLVILLAGTHNYYYRVETALRAMAIIARQCAEAQLLVLGRLSWTPNERTAARMAQGLASDLGIANQVVFSGPYTQQEAPEIFRNAHILLHTQYNDACPTLVIEAMACGLPVVYSHSGGVPELVGDEAGIGIRSKLSWEQIFPPDPNALAQAVLQIVERRSEYSEAARQRAVEHFDLKPWLQRHREVFESLLSESNRD